MPTTKVRGVQINYEIAGDSGPLLHDRRNCGASEVVIDGDESEYDIWADDLYDLLSQLDALPAYVGGSSSGCRLSLLLALRHPEAVDGLMLWRVTGGQFAAQRLAQNYYGQFIDVARSGGMTAVCETEFFKERIDSRPSNRERLLAMDVERFIAVMSAWQEYFIQGANLPVIGASEEALAAIDVPALIIPGNDWTHPRRVGENLSRLMKRGELHILMTEDMDIDLSPPWDDREDELVALFSGFLHKAAAVAKH